MKRIGILNSVLVLSICLILAMAALGQQETQNQTQTARVTITAKGFEPSSISLRPKVPVQITFLRQIKETCATSVVMPDYKIDRELPLNEAVTIEFTPTKTGDVAFMCGMKMYRAKLVVKEQ